MADQESTEGFIGMPPGFAPAAPTPPASGDESVEVPQEIGRGLSDSATRRLPDRADRVRPQKPEIVFFPVAPGAPAQPTTPAPPAEQIAAPATPARPAQSATVAAPSIVRLAPVEPASEPAPPATSTSEATVLSPRRHASAAWRLIVPGIPSPVTVDTAIFLGRNPVSSRPGAATLALPDSDKSVSKTHALLEVDAGGLWVHDLGSVNGVWVVPPGAEAIEVTPSQRVAVPAGADLELGDLVIQIEHG
jgi:hypothetical protein